MAEVPYSLASDDKKEFTDNATKLLRDITEQRIGNSPIGDVFSSPGDVFTLQIAENSGLSKTANGELELNITADSLSNVPSGGIKADTVQKALNQIDGDKISKDGSTPCYIGSMQILGISGGAPPDYLTVIVPQLQAGNIVMWTFDYANALYIQGPAGWNKTYFG